MSTKLHMIDEEEFNWIKGRGNDISPLVYQWVTYWVPGRPLYNFLFCWNKVTKYYMKMIHCDIVNHVCFAGVKDNFFQNVCKVHQCHKPNTSNSFSHLNNATNSECPVQTPESLFSYPVTLYSTLLYPSALIGIYINTNQVTGHKNFKVNFLLLYTPHSALYPTLWPHDHSPREPLSAGIQEITVWISQNFLQFSTEKTDVLVFHQCSSWLNEAKNQRPSQKSWRSCTLTWILTTT